MEANEPTPPPVTDAPDTTGPLSNLAEQLVMSMVRERVVAAAFAHEECFPEHKGKPIEPCWPNRANIIAFLAHSLGLRAEEWEMARETFERYNAECPDCEDRKRVD